jgi:hypothetical protein
VKAGVGVSAENHVTGAICGAVGWVRGQVVTGVGSWQHWWPQWLRPVGTSGC